MQRARRYKMIALHWESQLSTMVGDQQQLMVVSTGVAGETSKGHSDANGAPFFFGTRCVLPNDVAREMSKKHSVDANGARPKSSWGCAAGGLRRCQQDV